MTLTVNKFSPRSGPLGDDALDWMVGPRWRRLDAHIGTMGLGGNSLDSDFMGLVGEIGITQSIFDGDSHGSRMTRESTSFDEELTYILFSHDTVNVYRFDLHLMRDEDFDVRMAPTALAVSEQEVRKSGVY